MGATASVTGFPRTPQPALERVRIRGSVLHHPLAFHVRHQRTPRSVQPLLFGPAATINADANLVQPPEQLVPAVVGTPLGGGHEHGENDSESEHKPRQRCVSVCPMPERGENAACAGYRTCDTTFLDLPLCNAHQGSACSRFATFDPCGFRPCGLVRKAMPVPVVRRGTSRRGCTCLSQR